MNNKNNHNYTIHDLSNLSGLSNNTFGSITNEEMRKEIISHKKSIEAQKRLINNYKSDLQNNNIETNYNYNYDNLIKTSSSKDEQIIKLNEEIKNLSKENKSLKKIIEDKDKLISEFEEVVLKSKEKFNKLQKINNALKEEIIILKNKGGINSERKNEIDMNKTKENINNKFNDIQVQISNSMSKSLNKGLINNENEVDINENEKDKLIEKLNSQLIYIYNEYINLSNIIDEMNIYLSNNNLNPNYNELKLKNDELTKEIKILKEKLNNKDIINANNKNKEIELNKKIEAINVELNERNIELNKIKKNYEELFKNYQNTVIELKEKEKIYKNFQNKLMEKNKNNQPYQQYKKSKGINYNNNEKNN